MAKKMFWHSLSNKLSLKIYILNRKKEFYNLSWFCGLHQVPLILGESSSKLNGNIQEASAHSSRVWVGLTGRLRSAGPWKWLILLPVSSSSHIPLPWDISSRRLDHWCDSSRLPKSTKESLSGLCRLRLKLALCYTYWPLQQWRCRHVEQTWGRCGGGGRRGWGTLRE